MTPAAAAKTAGHLEREQVARERASALAPHVPKIIIQVMASDLPGLDVQRDGVPVGKSQWGTPIPADPGEHRIVATAPGRRAWEKVLTVAIDQAVAVVVPTFDSTPTARPGEAGEGFGTQRVLALVAGGIGVVGLAVGTAFGLSSVSKHDEAEQHCSGSACRDQVGVDLRAQALRAGNASTVGFILGAAGLAGGATLWLTAKSDSTTGLRPGIGVGFGTLVVTQSW